MRTIAVFGAAGKMGTRISEALGKRTEYCIMCVEKGASGEAALRSRGVEPIASDTAAANADALVLAVPDIHIGSVAAEVVPAMRPGAMLVCLDPAAPLAGMLPERADITYFVTHPCHPSFSRTGLSLEALGDYFGGTAPQAIVCALMQGPEGDYARGEALCRDMFAPVSRAHRITLEQMAVLEPAMSETVALTFLTLIREAMDQAIGRGVPKEAALDFMLGHLNVSTAILFGLIDAQVSDGARLAVERARASLVQPDWAHVFQPENLMEQVRAIVGNRRS